MEFRPDPYRNIVGYAQKFKQRLKELLNNQPGLASPTVEADVFAVLMDKNNVNRLLTHRDCVKLAAIIGIANDGSRAITISLLAVGSDGKVLPQHRLPPEDHDFLLGEEVWPDKITINEMDTFLPLP